jgi:hypothetical protein
LASAELLHGVLPSQLDAHILEAQYNVLYSPIGAPKGNEGGLDADSMTLRYVDSPKRARVVPTGWSVNGFPRERTTDEVEALVSCEDVISQDVVLRGRLGSEESPKGTIDAEAVPICAVDLKCHGPVLEESLEKRQGIGNRAELESFLRVDHLHLRCIDL